MRKAWTTFLIFFQGTFLLLVLIAVFLPGGPRAQNAESSASPSTAAAQAPAARPGDVDTIEHILAAVYDVISGPAGVSRDWDRFRTLYYPGARLIPIRRDDKGAITTRILTSEDFVIRGKEIFANQGFFETPIANNVEQWDHMAHVWSIYESRHAKGEQPFTRGVNSFQLINDGARWWILSTCWENEDPGHPLPDKYLK